MLKITCVAGAGPPRLIFEGDVSSAIMEHTFDATDELCINTIRTLSMDAVQKANSGHPGTPMALAPTAPLTALKNERLFMIISSFSDFVPISPRRS